VYVDGEDAGLFSKTYQIPVQFIFAKFNDKLNLYIKVNDSRSSNTILKKFNLFAESFIETQDNSFEESDFYRDFNKIFEKFNLHFEDEFSGKIRNEIFKLFVQQLDIFILEPITPRLNT
jgi:hypothetical protein